MEALEYRTKCYSHMLKINGDRTPVGPLFTWDIATRRDGLAQLRTAILEVILGKTQQYQWRMN